jgi:hypothetical protein
MGVLMGHNYSLLLLLALAESSLGLLVVRTSVVFSTGVDMTSLDVVTSESGVHKLQDDQRLEVKLRGSTPEYGC